MFIDLFRSTQTFGERK